MTGSVLAVDFGTSFSSAAIREPHGQVRIVSFGGQGGEPMPSSLFYRGPDLDAGSRAVRQAATEPLRFLDAPKRVIGYGRVQLGDRQFTDVELVTRVLTEVLGEAYRQGNGTLPPTVRLTHPAEWAAGKLTVLRSAAAAAGIPGHELVAEPVAAASYHVTQGSDVPDGGAVCVYDLGGGTFDVAVVRRTATGFEVVGQPRGIDPMGGDQFDHVLLDHVVGQIRRRDPALADTLARLPDLPARRARRRLHEQVRAAKHELSGQHEADVVVDGLDEVVLVTRGEFEQLIGRDIDETVRLTGETIGRAGFAPDQLAGIVLVGGSARIPLVMDRLRDAFACPVITRGDPKLAVAEGAAVLGDVPVVRTGPPVWSPAGPPPSGPPPGGPPPGGPPPGGPAPGGPPAVGPAPGSSSYPWRGSSGSPGRPHPVGAGTEPGAVTPTPGPGPVTAPPFDWRRGSMPEPRTEHVGPGMPSGAPASPTASTPGLNPVAPLVPEPAVAPPGYPGPTGPPVPEPGAAPAGHPGPVGSPFPNPSAAPPGHPGSGAAAPGYSGSGAAPPGYPGSGAAAPVGYPGPGAAPFPDPNAAPPEHAAPNLAGPPFPGPNPAPPGPPGANVVSPPFPETGSGSSPFPNPNPEASPFPEPQPPGNPGPNPGPGWYPGPPNGGLPPGGPASGPAATAGRAGAAGRTPTGGFWFSDARSLLGLTLVVSFQFLGTLAEPTLFTVLLYLVFLPSVVFDGIRLVRAPNLVAVSTLSQLLIYAIDQALWRGEFFSSDEAIVAWTLLVIAGDLVPVVVSAVKRRDRAYRLSFGLIGYLVLDAVKLAVWLVELTTYQDVLPDPIAYTMSVVGILLLVVAAVQALVSSRRAARPAVG